MVISPPINPLNASKQQVMGLSLWGRWSPKDQHPIGVFSGLLRFALSCLVPLLLVRFKVSLPHVWFIAPLTVFLLLCPACHHHTSLCYIGFFVYIVFCVCFILMVLDVHCHLALWLIHSSGCCTPTSSDIAPRPCQHFVESVFWSLAILISV